MTVGFAPTAAGQSTLVVDDDNAECPNAGFSDIQAAVDAAVSGDTVEVCAGTYDGPIVVNKAIELVGAGPDAVTITNTQGPTDLPKPNGALVVLGDSPMELPGLTFEGFTVEATPALSTNFNSLSLIRYWAAGSTTDPVTIRGNVLAPGGHPSVAGIISNGGPGHIDVVDNTVGGQETVGVKYGMFLNGGHHTTIEGNTFSRIHFSGIALGQGANNHPFQSLVPHHLSIVSNTIEQAGLDESFAGGDSIFHTTFHVHDGAHDVSIEGNFIRDTDGAVMEFHDRGPATDLSNVVLHFNAFENNTEGINNPFSPTIDATHNWWGQPGTALPDQNDGNVDDGFACLVPMCTVQEVLHANNAPPHHS